MIKTIEKMQSDFLWDPGGNRRDHLLNWDMVCNDRKREIGAGKFINLE